MAKVLITGANGFAARYVAKELSSHGYEVHGLARGFLGNLPDYQQIHHADLDKPDTLFQAMVACAPDAVIHLAAISFVEHSNINAIYQTNLIGTRNLLSSIYASKHIPKITILASSANIYGNSNASVLTENAPLSPANDYAISKASMELAAKIWFDKFPITIVRPFNFIGVGQNDNFLISKIITHCLRNSSTIELGNLQVERDFSDVRCVANIYRRLIESPAPSQIFNICSGKGYSIHQILRYLNEITNWNPEIIINKAFIRENEIIRLIGSKAFLEQHIGPVENPDLMETLQWMLKVH